MIIIFIFSIGGIQDVHFLPTLVKDWAGTKRDIWGHLKLMGVALVCQS